MNFAPANPENPFQAEWRADLERTDLFKRPDSAPPRPQKADDFSRHPMALSQDIEHHLGVPLSELLGVGQTKWIIRRRFMYFRLMKAALPHLSAARLANTIGMSRHSLEHGLKRAKKFYDTDDTFKGQYDTLAGKVL